MKHATDTIDTSKTSSFTFLPNRKWHAVRALAIALQGDVPLFKVGTRICTFPETPVCKGIKGRLFPKMWGHELPAMLVIRLNPSYLCRRYGEERT